MKNKIYYTIICSLICFFADINSSKAGVLEFIFGHTSLCNREEVQELILDQYHDIAELIILGTGLSEFGISGEDIDIKIENIKEISQNNDITICQVNFKISGFGQESEEIVKYKVKIKNNQIYAIPF